MRLAEITHCCGLFVRLSVYDVFKIYMLRYLRPHNRIGDLVSINKGQSSPAKNDTAKRREARLSPIPQAFYLVLRNPSKYTGSICNWNERLHNLISRSTKLDARVYLVEYFRFKPLYCSKSITTLRLLMAVQKCVVKSCKKLCFPKFRRCRDAGLTLMA
jgi:hypothetical protein